MTDHTPSGLPQPQTVAEQAKQLWETIKILGLSNDKLALMAITSALAPAVETVAVQEEVTDEMIRAGAKATFDFLASTLPVAPKAEPANRIGKYKKLISQTIGYEWEPGELQTVNADDLLRLIDALATPQAASAQPVVADTLTDARKLLIEAHNAIEAVLAWDGRRGFPVPYKVRDPLHAALGSIRAALASPPRAIPAEQAGEPVAKVRVGLHGQYVEWLGAMPLPQGTKLYASTAPAEQAAPTEPVAFSLRWSNDPRLNLSTVFDTESEAEAYAKRCGVLDGGPPAVVPLYEAADRSAEAVRDAAQTALDAYEDRFESTTGKGLYLGPIDEEMKALRAALAAMGTPAAAEPGKGQP